MRFCFRLMLVATAGVTVAAAASNESGRTVRSVVRTDANGRLVRSVVVTPRVVHENVIAPRQVPAVEEELDAAVSTPTGPIRNFNDAVDYIARKNSLPAPLVHSVISVESGYNPNAVSPKGAMGLMQLIPSTARRFGVNNVFNPVQNVEGGAKYLRYLLDLYHGDYRLALAAYNAGEGAVNKHRGVPPYPETQNYLQMVQKRLVEAAQKRKAEQLVAKPPEPAKPLEHNLIREVVEPDGRVRYINK